MTLHPILRVLHILAGSFWVGGVVLNAAYLIPAVMASGPAGGQVMRVMVQVRRLPVYMNSVMAISLLTGLWLYGLDSGGFHLAWITSSVGIALTFGALCAIATAGIGHSVTVPVVSRIGRLGATIAGAGAPPSPEQAAEMGALQHRLLAAVRASAALLVLATIAMAVARFV